MIERQIIIGLITSTEFIQRIRERWDIKFISSSTAKTIALWCMEYFDKYEKAPERNIEAIFHQKVKSGLSKDIAEEIEEDILPELSEEYENSGLNVDYLVTETLKYFDERHLRLHKEQLEGLLDAGQLEEAEKLACDFKPIANNSGSWIDLSGEKTLDKLEIAFNRSADTLIKYPGAYGEFINDQLVRGAFVAFMSIEKQGKTFHLLEMAMRACKQGRRVAFFQAGDMTEFEQLIRISVYLSRKSNKENYCGQMFVPVKDCVLNQLNQCTREERSCDFGIFEGNNEKYLRREVTLDEIKKEFEINQDYKTCSNCDEYKKNKWGSVWVKEINIKDPLTSDEAKNSFTNFFIKHKRFFKLSSHTNRTLTVKQMDTILDIWVKEGFVADVIITDYADIMDEPTEKDFRHKQNNIWMGLRGLSQKRHALVITVTQTDSDAYKRDLLSLDNFSEDKRKYAHVTAMWGMNRDHKGREKELSILRLNELVKREGDFNNSRQVHILQNLKRGRPFLGSYW